MTQVKVSVLRRLPLPYTTTHHDPNDWFIKSMDVKDFTTRQRLVEQRLSWINDPNPRTADLLPAPYEITLSIAGRIVTDRFVRDEHGRWTHYDLISEKTATYGDGSSLDRG